MSRFDERYLNIGDVYDIIMQAKTVDQSMNVLYLPYVEIPKWTPVTERLPKKYKKVIVSVTGVISANYTDVDFVTDTGMWFFYENRVTAWMPLPEAYREEQE